MTRNFWIGVLVGMLALTASGCANVALSPTGTSAPSRGGSITIESVHVAPGDRIVFAGRSTLPGGMCLQTQLYADGDPEVWWPVDTCVAVQNGAWRIVVPLGEGEAPGELDPTVEYTLHAWQQDDPSVEAEVFWFDLAGPPEE